MKRTLFVISSFLFSIQLLGASWTDQYSSIKLVGVEDKQFWLVQKDSYYGLVDMAGNEMLSPEYEEIVTFNNNVPYLGIHTEQGYFGVYDPIREKQVVPPIYAAVYSDITKFVKGGGFWVQSNGWWGYYDATGKIIIPTTLHFRGVTRKAEYCIMKSGEYAVLIDSCGNLIIPAGMYHNIKPLSNRKFCVYKDHNAGICDSNGELLFMTPFNNLEYDRKENNYVAYVGNSTGRIALDGSIIQTPNRTLSKQTFNTNGVSYTKLCNQQGLFGIEKNGQLILPCEYDSIQVVGDYYYLYNKGYMGVSGKDGKIIIPIGVCHSINKLTSGQDFFLGFYSNKIRLFTFSGREFLKPSIFTDCGLQLYHGDQLLVQADTKKGICDTLGNIIVEPRYSKIEDFANNYRVFVGGVSGMYTTKGHCVVPPLYSSVTHFYNNKQGWDFYKVYDYKNNKQGLYTVDGKLIIPADVFTYVDVESSTIIAKNSERTCKFSLQGKLLYDSYEEDQYDKYFNLGGTFFEQKQYRKAIDNYQQALSFRKTASAYFNIAASHYNLGHYNDAITYYNYCLNSNPSSALAIRAKEDIHDARNHIENMSSRRARIAQMVLGGILGMTTAIVQANTASYNNPAVYNPYNPGSNYNFNRNDYNQVFNQIYQQSVQQTNYEMAQRQQLMSNMMYVSYQQTKQQFELEYAEFARYNKKPDGSEYTYEEWEQMKAQAYHAHHHEDVNHSDDESHKHNGHDELIEKVHEFYDSNYGYTDCPMCLGSGECSVCHGTGLQDAGFGLGKTVCGSCKGDKKCRICMGKGKVYRHK